jgi:ketosteroid isomerase-like protein
MHKFLAATSIFIASGFLSAFNNVGTGSEVNRPGDVERLLGLEVAANSDPTMDGFAGYLARDGVEADLSAPGWYESREQYIDMVKQQFAMVQQLKATVSDSNVVTDGTLGCVATQIHINGMLKDGSSLSISFRALDAWKKINGRWQYTQLHIVSFRPKHGHVHERRAGPRPRRTQVGEQSIAGSRRFDRTGKKGDRKLGSG